MFFIEKVIR